MCVLGGQKSCHSEMVPLHTHNKVGSHAVSVRIHCDSLYSKLEAL